ncbi:MAG TPA: MraY family glycosyltransferase [Verrucomicrobiae bacterium]|jgi:UDP-GlcNAc:undecaprenyl-phosphate GlcNAc-1-phosphate transferase|nr:MraY family glycosyltransferase [Verrucomicrobiae bacterium]
MQLVVFIISVLSSAVFTRWIRDFAVARGWVTPPASSRHLHTQPLPRFGGLAILLTLWEMVLLSRWMPGHFGLSGLISTHLAIGILGPATLIFFLGLVDDIRGLKAYTKFGVQILAAVWLYFNGFGISLVSIKTGGVSVGWLIGLPLTIIWVLWITNAFNLIDGLDGLAAGSALFSTLVICIIALLSHNVGILFLTLVLAGAIAGFLRYNFNPASIFLGDCGSLLIGFLLSAIALAGSQKSPTMVAVAIPIVSLGLPILDVTISVLRRFLSRKQLFGADREHIHHKLMSRGVPHKQAVLLLYGVSGCFGLLSLFLLNPGGETVGMVLVVLGIGVLVGVQQLRYHEFFELKQEASRTLNLRHVIANNVSIRRSAEALHSCETLADFCLILQKCLQPIGFDGFGIDLTVDLPTDLECFPLRQTDDSQLYHFWDNTLILADTNWNLTFSLANRKGKRVGSFTLYRRSNVSPLWIDLSVFNTTGFASALGEKVESIQNDWLTQDRDELTTAYESSAASD